MGLIEAGIGRSCSVGPDPLHAAAKLGDEEVSGGVVREGGRLVELDRRADRPRGIDATDVTLVMDEAEPATRMQGDLDWKSRRGAGCGPSVARAARAAVSRNHAEPAGGLTEDPVGRDIDHEQRAARLDHHVDRMHEAQRPWPDDELPDAKPPDLEHPSSGLGKDRSKAITPGRIRVALTRCRAAPSWATTTGRLEAASTPVQGTHLPRRTRDQPRPRRWPPGRALDKPGASNPSITPIPTTSLISAFTPAASTRFPNQRRLYALLPRRYNPSTDGFLQERGPLAGGPRTAAQSHV